MDNPLYWETPPEGLPWISIGDMSTGEKVTTTKRAVSREGIQEKRLPIGPPGTLLFAMYASVGALAFLAVRASWNQALLGLQPVEDQADLRFVRYWLQHLRPSLSEITRSSTQENLNAEQVGNLPFPTFKLPEQQQVADFLDRETNRIDAIIGKCRESVELLRERRQTLITAAVTGDLEVAA